jgi:hypothetical protein
MQNPSTDRYVPPTPTNAYCPSVPISVYRELAAELQTAQAKLDSLTAQNQHLVKQNQQLRQEVEKVVQSAQHLQQIASTFGQANQGEVPRPMPPAPPHRPTATVPKVEFPSSVQNSEPDFGPYKETVVIEQEEPRPRRTSHSEGISDINGWFLVVAILGIVLTAFGAGFWVVRPLLNNSNR